MTDDLNEVGKVLRITNDTASAAAKRDSAEYPMEESVRDIFDAVVPYNAYFKVKKGANKVNAILSFELPPPNKGQGTCCGDCYCAIGETFPSDDEDWGLDLVLQRPYVPGSVRLGMADFMYPNGGITETDPEAGIVTLSNAVFTAGRTITVYYVYAYADCTTNIPPDPCLPYSDYLDDFNGASTYQTLPPFSQVENTIGGSPLNSSCMQPWEFDGGILATSTPNVTQVYTGWYLDGAGNAVFTTNNVDNNIFMDLETNFEDQTSPFRLPYSGPNINCDTEIKFKTDYVPGDIVAQTEDGYLDIEIQIWDGNGNRYEWLFKISSSSQDFSGIGMDGEYKGIYFNPSVDNGNWFVTTWQQDFNWQEDTWYIFKARTLMDGTVRWKIWVDGDTEPDWFEVSYYSGGPWPWTMEQIEAYNNEDYANAGDVSPSFFSIEIDEQVTSPLADDGVTVEQYHLYFDYIKMTDPT